MPRSYDPSFDEAPRTSHRAFTYALMLVIAAAFAGFVWNWFATPVEAPTIHAEAGAYKVAPQGEAAPPDAGEQNAFFNALEGRAEPGAVTPRAGPEAPLAPAPALAETNTPPVLVGAGPFLAQLAALQSEAGVAPAWARLQARAPDLFAGARLDVQRADLGARGLYYRVRAGYFADRANATRFCERVRVLGQDCIVVAR